MPEIYVINVTNSDDMVKSVRTLVSGLHNNTSHLGEKILSKIYFEVYGKSNYTLKSIV